MFETLLQDPESIAFPILFVILLAYVMRTNEKREENYRETISDMRQALLDNKKVATKVDNIHAKLIEDRRETG